MKHEKQVVLNESMINCIVDSDCVLKIVLGKNKTNDAVLLFGRNEPLLVSMFLCDSFSNSSFILHPEREQTRWCKIN